MKKDSNHTLASYIVSASIVTLTLCVLRTIELFVPVPEWVYMLVLAMLIVTFIMAKETHRRLIVFVRRWLDSWQ